MAEELKHFQIRNFPDDLRRAIKVAAALEDSPSSKWIIKQLRKAVKQAGIQIEEGDKTNG